MAVRYFFELFRVNKFWKKDFLRCLLSLQRYFMWASKLVEFCTNSWKKPWLAPPKDLVNDLLVFFTFSREKKLIIDFLNLSFSSETFLHLSIPRTPCYWYRLKKPKTDGTDATFTFTFSSETVTNWEVLFFGFLGDTFSWSKVFNSVFGLLLCSVSLPIQRYFFEVILPLAHSTLD